MQPCELAPVLAYIDAHLDSELDLADLANLAGYSPRHFARRFKAATGETVSQRLLARRLRRALCDMAAGTTAIDAVLRYGFDTYAGFYKAFVRMYGCSPRAYLKIYASGLPPETEWERIIMPTKNELKGLLKCWPEYADKSISYIPIIQDQTVSDTSFRIGDDSVLKLYHDEPRLKKVLKLAWLLAEQGLPASTAIPTGDGRVYLEKDGLFVALVRRVPGDPFKAEQWFGPKGEDYALQAGRALAALHGALRAVEDRIETSENDPYAECKDWALPSMRKQDAQWNLGLGDAFFEDYLQTFGALDPQLPRQLIHRDPNPSNLMFEGDQVSGFIDFDHCMRNVRLFDICYAATGIMSECGGSEERYERWPGILRAIVRGYDEVEPLTEAEKQSVFYVVVSIQFIFCVWCESMGDPYIKAMAATDRKMLMFIVKNRARIEQGI